MIRSGTGTESKGAWGLVLAAGALHFEHRFFVLVLYENKRFVMGVCGKGGGSLSGF